MMTLDKPSQAKLKKIKWALEKFFYTSGTNIAFYNASRDPRARVFRERCEKALEKQIKPYLKESNVKALREQVPPKLEKIDDAFLEAIVLALFDSFVDLIEGGANYIDEFLRWAGGLGGQSAFDKAGISVTFKLFNPEVVAKLRDRQLLLINSVDNTTKEWIGRTVASGYQKGLSDSEIIKQLMRLGKTMTALRARKIVETEIAHAMGLVEWETMKRNGSEFKEWTTSRDERVCPTCLGNEKQGPIPVNEEFESGVMTVPAHVFCRCYMKGSIPPDLDINELWTGD